MNFKWLFFYSCVVFTLALSGAEWGNVTPENHIGGRMASNGYLRGKVVLLDVRDYSNDQDEAEMKQIQDIWTAYKSKSFVAIGSNSASDSSDAARELVKRLSLTYSIYDNVKHSEDGVESKLPNGVYVFDSIGRKIYFGNSPRMAMGIVGTAIFSSRIPSSVKYWRDILDYEIANLPGHAYLRILDLKKKKDVLQELVAQYPDDAKRFSTIWNEYSKNTEVKKLAKLVESARLIKDSDKTFFASRRAAPVQIDRLIAQYSSLAKSENPLIVQEAKNSLADLKFTKANLKSNNRRGR